MTMIKFNYNDSYGQPSRGSLAFMPHRRHAANETEILPKPFTMPLLNGEATVNLQPNSSSWVWIITEYFENQAKSFYTTIPDKDRVIPHTELVHINPSSIPAAYDAVEPAWWAEMRQFKTVVSDTLLKSGDALNQANAALEYGETSKNEAHQSALTSKAYAEQSTQSAYSSQQYRDEARQHRDEAQYQADRAASGPESAAQRAKDYRDDAERHADNAALSKDDAQNSASQARSSETNAQAAANNATNSADDARSEFRKAEIEADRARQEADRAQGYANDLLDQPQQLVDTVTQYADTVEAHVTTVEGHVATVAADVQTANEHKDAAQNHANQALTYLQQTEATAENFTSAKQHGEWFTPTLLNDFKSSTAAPIKARKMSTGELQIIGRIGGGENRNKDTQIMANLPVNLSHPFDFLAFSINNNTVPLTVTTDGHLHFSTGDNLTDHIVFNTTIPDTL